jgi:hypothetical protein
MLLVLLLAACGGDDAGGGLQPGAGDSLQPTDDLVVEQDLGDGSTPQRWTLGCRPAVTGDHPQAEQACAHLADLDEPFAPLPDDQFCTEVYGGPQTARVTGVWAGEPVELSLSRTNGCQISQWDGLGPLLPGPVGGTGPEDAPQ